MSIASDIQKLNPGSLIEFFTLDATGIGGEVFNFHAGTNGLQNDVVWQGVSYARYPVEADGFELKATGTAPRPKLRASNIGGVLGRAVKDIDDLVGAKITRKRTFVRYLDAVNFADGNPYADPNVAFSDDVYFVDRKSAENKVMIEWELVSAMDLAGVKLPSRQIIANYCTWKYRGSECNYTGGPCADFTDAPTTDPDADNCGHRLASCRLRFAKSNGGNGVLRFGGFPAAGLVRG